MTVLELMQELQAMCFRGQGTYDVKFCAGGFEGPVHKVAIFSTRQADANTFTRGQIMLGVACEPQGVVKAEAA